MESTDKKKMFPCPLCERDLEIKVSITEKPYCICLDCGMQIFFRGKEGISRLERKTGFDLESFNSGELNQGTKPPLGQLIAELKEVNDTMDNRLWSLLFLDNSRRNALILKIEAFQGKSGRGKIFIQLISDLREAYQEEDSHSLYSGQDEDDLRKKRDDLISGIENA